MWVEYSGKDEDYPYSWDPDVMGERQLSRLQNFCTVVHGQLVHHPWNIEVTISHIRRCGQSNGHPYGITPQLMSTPAAPLIVEEWQAWYDGVPGSWNNNQFAGNNRLFCGFWPRKEPT